MITVDCSDALQIKDKLLVYVADKLKVLPILKNEKFMLASIDDSHKIKKSSVVFAIREFLESKKLEKIVNVIEIEKEDIITVKPFEGKKIIEEEGKENKDKNVKQLFFECTHCGFMTQYESELKTHRLIHYI